MLYSNRLLISRFRASKRDCRSVQANRMNDNKKQTYTCKECGFEYEEKSWAAKFATLSKNGNSSCSGAFKDSIDTMLDTARLEGSCCSPMDIHRYTEQVTGLQKYADIPEIPSDPYDIDAALAKKLKVYYDVELSPDEQKAYDYAMANSMEKGPCCCKCWRWYVYGGLGKLLIQKYNFTGEQITEVWNLSDGCGGDSEGH